MFDEIDVNGDLFVLGIQTKEQRDMFIKGSQKILCIDATHSTNRYGFALVTLLVPDEFGKGYPEIKKRCPPDFTSNACMTDDDNSGWNALTSVFGEWRHLLCKWHIHRAWTRKLSLVPENYRDEIC